MPVSLRIIPRPHGTPQGQPPPLDSARALAKRTIMPLLVPYGEKNPNRRNWQDERVASENLHTIFNGHQQNVGMLLGDIRTKDGLVLTDRFIDADLDTPEAAVVARYFLPQTGMMWGRKSKPRSHYGYRVRTLDGAETVQNFVDPLMRGKDATICELRFTGGQTIAPGSVNMASGKPELVRWESDGDGDPAEVDFFVLKDSMTRVWAGALIARYWTEGIRHLVALPLAGMLCRGGMPQEIAETLIRAVCEAAHDPQPDDRLGCVRDTYAKASAGDPYTGKTRLEDYWDSRLIAKLRKLLNLKSGFGGDIGPDGFVLSDIGNAERFVAKYEGTVLYCDDENAFYVYDGTRWQQDRENRVWTLAINVVNEFRAYTRDRTLPNLGNTPSDDWDRHLRKFGSARGMADMLRIVRALLPVRPEDFNADPMLLNVLNGTIELDVTTGRHTIHAHRQEDRLTKLWRANYVPDATSEDVDAYRRQFVPDTARWEFLEEAVAYSLDGRPKRYNIQLLGPSNAGKSMLLRILSEQAGDYAQPLDYQALLPDRNGGGGKPRSDLKDLRGARIITVPEVGHGAVWDSALFKLMLSGGDRTKVRGAYDKRTQDFAFTATLWTSGNKPYGADADDDAAYERTHVVRFEHPMPKDQRDEHAEQRTVDPAITGDAFLACWLRGFTRLYGAKHGRLTPPDVVKRATDQLRDDLDPYAELLDEHNMLRFTGDPDDGVVASEVWDWVRAFREESGKRIKSVRTEKDALARTLTRRGATYVADSPNRFNRRAYWRGVAWVPTFAEGCRVSLPDWKEQPIGE